MHDRISQLEKSTWYVIINKVVRKGKIKTWIKFESLFVLLFSRLKMNSRRDNIYFNLYENCFRFIRSTLFIFFFKEYFIYTLIYKDLYGHVQIISL